MFSFWVSACTGRLTQRHPCACQHFIEIFSCEFVCRINTPKMIVPELKDRMYSVAWFFFGNSLLLDPGLGHIQNIVWVAPPDPGFVLSSFPSIQSILKFSLLCHVKWHFWADGDFCFRYFTFPCSLSHLKHIQTLCTVSFWYQLNCLSAKRSPLMFYIDMLWGFPKKAEQTWL